MQNRLYTVDKAEAKVKRNKEQVAGVTVHGHWDVKCFDKDGQLKWNESFENLVTNAGLDHVLDATLAAGSQITTWYVGLAASTPTPAAGDTAGSHAGWTENENYDEAVRQTWTAGAVGSQSVDNSGSTADFTMDTDSDTVGGLFLISDDTKGGSTGTLFSIGAFAGDKNVDDGDTLQCTITYTAADA